MLIFLRGRASEGPAEDVAGDAGTSHGDQHGIGVAPVNKLERVDLDTPRTEARRAGRRG